MDKLIELVQTLFAELEQQGFITKTRNEGQKAIYLYNYDDGHIFISGGTGDKYFEMLRHPDGHIEDIW